MLFVVKVQLEVTPYMNSSQREEKLHTIEAETLSDASYKLEKYYESKSIPYAISYQVVETEWAEHIQ